MNRALWVSCLVLVGCPGGGVAPREKPPAVDADANGGPEAQRSGARPLPLGRALTDSVSWPKLMRTKWKAVEVDRIGRVSILDCQLAVDRPEVDLDIDLFDTIGKQIGFSPAGPAPGGSKRLAVPVSQAGTYFVRVRAARPQDESDFSLRCEFEANAARTPPQQPETPTEAADGGAAPDLAPATAPGELAADAGVEGRVLGAYREGEFLVLQLNKGSAAGVRVGMKGKLLEGRSGRKVLEGGDFEVVQVVGPTGAIARARLPQLGANVRAVILTR